MNRKLRVMALVGILFLSIHTANAYAQDQGHTDITNAEGKTIGTASLSDTRDGVLLIIDVGGLPDGLHAVHVPAVGKCEDPAFTRAGPHFYPMNKQHGVENAAGPHAGDLPDMYVE